MNEVIGYWVISLAFTLLVTGIEPNFNLKDKIACVTGIMVFVTLICIGAWFICGA